MSAFRAISIFIFNFCLCIFGFTQTIKNSRIASLNNFPLKANPTLIGKALVERFMHRPHSSFGAFNPTPPNEITYPDACAWYGALRFAKRTGDKDLTQRLIKRAELLLNEESKLLPYAKDVDRAVIGIIPLEVYNQTKDERFLKIGLIPADEQFKTLSTDEYAKLSNQVKNSYARGLSWHTRFWMDDMYMITALQSQAYRATGNNNYLDRTAREMIVYLDSLQTPLGLFYHAYDAPFYWARGDGWLAAGMAELLSILPKNNIYRPRIMQGYKEMMKTLLQFQDKEGMWHQLIDDPDSWPETSGSAMFTFAFIIGIKNGWLDEKTYGKAVRKAWTTLCGYLDENSDLREICIGTNKKNDRQYYLERKRVTGDLHGQAPMIWCAMELVK